MLSHTHAAAAPARRRRCHPLLWLLLMLAVGVGGFRLLTGHFPFQPHYTQEGRPLDQQILNKLDTLALTQPRVKEILRRTGDYPADLLALLARNEETLDFVLGYPQHKDDPPADTVGALVQGEFPLLMQWDSRWGYACYGDGLMALNGCGPTALAMAVCGLTGDSSVTPYAVARYAQEQGYYVNGVGTSWELMSQGAAHFGLTTRVLPLDEGTITRALERGEPILCSVGPGDFTTSGHFILLVGLEDGQIRVNDPNRRSTSARLWDYDTLAGQINNLWACSLA